MGMHKKRPSAENRVNIYLPPRLKARLKTALLRRHLIAASNGHSPAISISGWVREQAEQTIKNFK